MGVKYSSKVWEWSQAEGNDRLVLLALADWADDDGLCWPGIARVAKRCRISERTVQRSIRTLEAIGEVIIEPGLGQKTATGPTNRYRLFIAPPDKRGVELAPVGEGVSNQASRGDNLSLEGVSPLSPKPSVEPSVNHHASLFEMFWKNYPKKVARIAALRAWNKLKPDAILSARIVDAVKAHKQTEGWLKESGRFIPNAGSWLNGHRWEDDVAPAGPGAPRVRIAEPAVGKYE